MCTDMKKTKHLSLSSYPCYLWLIYLERAVRLELTISDLQSGALAAWRRAQIGTEGEIRIPTGGDLEDSHVSGYITSASGAN